MHFIDHDKAAAYAKAIEKSFVLAFRIIAAVAVVTLTICLIVNVVIPLAAAIVPLLNEVLFSYLVHLFGS